MSQANALCHFLLDTGFLRTQSKNPFMQISGHGKETFLFLNGLGVRRVVRLGKNLELCPASCSPSPEDIIKVSRNETDLGITIIFLRHVTSQIRIVADTPKELAARAWNSMWDAILLSAFFRNEVACNFQCDTPAEKFGPKSKLEITNYHLRGLSAKPRMLVETEAVWIEENFEQARSLLKKSAFQNAVHSLWSYRWHTYSNMQLAILWAGIEGLFDVNSEIVFRLSLYAARFLAPDNEVERSQIFSDVKRLYKQRSAAVHGSKIKGDSKISVDKSAQLLLKLIRQCVDCKSLPCIEKLAP
jgi:hypothetical protein